jgi:hypothetical protein
MITIDQLLESVDLDFEPRWVTKDQNGMVWLWEKKPQAIEKWWDNTLSLKEIGGKIKLSEFDGKDWQECIYEVPRKTDEYEQNLEKLRPADSDLVYRVHLPRKTTGKIEKLKRHIRVENGYEISCPPDESEIIEKINELVDAVNELKGANQ